MQRQDNWTEASRSLSSPSLLPLHSGQRRHITGSSQLMGLELNGSQRRTAARRRCHTAAAAPHRLLGRLEGSRALTVRLSRRVLTPVPATSHTHTAHCTATAVRSAALTTPPHRTLPLPLHFSSSMSVQTTKRVDQAKLHGLDIDETQMTQQVSAEEERERERREGGRTMGGRAANQRGRREAANQWSVTLSSACRLRGHRPSSMRAVMVCL